MIRVKQSSATQYATDLLKAVGCPPDQAAIIADVLITANLRGVDSHGLLRLPVYLKRLRLDIENLGRLINPLPEMKITKQSGSIAQFDADRAMGQLAGTKAMDLCCDIASNNGIAAVAVTNSNHFGTCAQFTCQAASRGCVAMAFTHAESDVIPFGGSKPVLGTNPFSIGAPLGKHPFHLVIDMATSHIAFGKVFQAAAAGESIPNDWGVDENGKPTTDPNNVRAVRPMAGPKGYGISLMIDLLAGVLTGANFGLDVKRMYHNFEDAQNIGHLFIAINIEHFMPLDQFKQRVDTFAQMLKSCPPEEGFKEVLLPGELEYIKQQDRQTNGFDLPEELIKDLSVHAAELNVNSPW